MAKSKVARRTAREDRLAAVRAQQRKAEQRRKALAIVAVVAVIGAVGGALAALQASSGGSGGVVSGKYVGAFTGPIGAEGMPIEQGTPLGPRNTALTGQPVDGMTCGAEQLVYHIHAHLGVFVDGKLRPVPIGIGAVANGKNCLYWLHTHETDGIIHVESPTQKTYTLGNFFDIWGQPLSRSQVGPAKGQVTVFVNAKKYTGDPRSLPLSPHENIQVDVGPVVAPKSINWANAQL